MDRAGFEPGPHVRRAALYMWLLKHNNCDTIFQTSWVMPTWNQNLTDSITDENVKECRDDGKPHLCATGPGREKKNIAVYL